ncbi:MAG TPA: LysR family transcriptional regulator [Pirellulaceae bacterium]|nr:LysR family transcriptional regulator [Pirellulaceae bacterium]
MELFQLRYFLKAAEREGFTRAAVELGISQPALSRAIANLELELGQPVFERQGRRVALTDAGRLLQSRAQQVVSLLEDAKNEITDDGESGRLRIAAIPTIAPYFLPGVLREFSRQHPRATVLIQEDVTDNALRKCAQGEVDAVILALPVPARHLDVEELFEEELILVLPAAHALAKKRGLTMKDIEPFPFVLLDEAHCLTDSILSFCRQSSFHPVAVERTNQLTTVQELVALGHGISMIPAMARELDTSDRRMYRSLSDVRPTRKVALCFNPYRFQSKLLVRFRECVREYAAKLHKRSGKRRKH